MDKKLLFDVTRLCGTGERSGLVISGVERVCLNQLLFLVRSGEFHIELYADRKLQQNIAHLQKNVPELQNCTVRLLAPLPRTAKLCETLGDLICRIHGRITPFRFKKWERFLVQKMVLPLWYRHVPVPEWLPQEACCFSCSDRFPPEFATAPNLLRIAMIHDIFPLLMPHFSDLRVLFFGGMIESHRRFAHQLLFNSELTLHDFETLYPQEPKERCHVLHLALDESCFSRSTDQAALQKYGIAPNEHYFLSVASFGKRKNLDRTIRCFLQMLKQHPESPLHLVLCGRKFDDAQAVIDAAGGSMRVHFTGFVEDCDLSALYHGADAYLFLSQYEGFGIPLLEAMYCHLPVLCSTAASLPEVAGNAALYCDPTNEPEITEKMFRIATDAQLRQKLIAAGDLRWRQFSWEKHGRELAGILHQA